MLKYSNLNCHRKGIPLDVAGFLNPTDIRKPFTSEAGFLNLPVTGLLNLAGVRKPFNSARGR